MEINEKERTTLTNKITMTISIPMFGVLLLISAFFGDPITFPSIFPIIALHFSIIFLVIVLVAWIEHPIYRMVSGIALVIIGFFLVNNWSLTYILIGGVVLCDGIASLLKKSFLDHVRDGAFAFGLTIVVLGGIVGFIFEMWNHIYSSGWIIDPALLPFPSIPLFGVPFAVIFAWIVACLLFFELTSVGSLFFTRDKKDCVMNKNDPECQFKKNDDRCLI